MNFNIKCDDYHMGNFCLDYIKKIPKDAIFHIDAATDERETASSYLSRVIDLALCFRKFGLLPGDVIALGGRNHLDLNVPFFAGMMNGHPIAGVDGMFKYKELKHLFNIIKPKVAFCQYEMIDEYNRTVKDLGLDTKIITFGGGDCTLKDFMKTYADSEPHENFKVATFDTENVYCWLLSTSGTTSSPKVVALRHSLLLRNLNYFITEDKDPRKPALNLSSMQWISACFNILTMPVNNVMVQTSAPVTTEHVIDIINKYKPVSIFTTPTLIAPILRHEKQCDLTCFDIIRIGGSTVHKEFLNALQARVRKGVICNGYGSTEIAGPVFYPTPDGPLGTLGKPMPYYDLKLVNSDTGEVILEPNVAGELWVKGEIMAGYYNDPGATADAYSPDGYFKTGDLMYRDENGHFFFVDRLKMLLKYRNHQVIPPELEEVILTHKDVADVCVTGIPHLEDGERVVACVVRKPGSNVTAQEIKDLVASQMSVGRHLHGGVVFVEELPMTSSGKVARVKVKELVINSNIE